LIRVAEMKVDCLDIPDALPERENTAQVVAHWMGSRTAGILCEEHPIELQVVGEVRIAGSEVRWDPSLYKS
jgi:hypothetical protein